MFSKILRKAILWTIASFVFVPPSPSKAQPFGISAQPPQASPHRGTLSGGSGRFVFGQISESSKDQFMLDTETGRLWRIAESGKIGAYLKPVPYCEEKSDCSPLPPKATQ